MVKWLTVHNDGEIVQDPKGEYAERAEVEKALKLIAEMRPYIKGVARLCEGGSDMQVELCGLVARAEELLRG